MLDAIYPPRCLGCGRFGEPLCSACRPRSCDAFWTTRGALRVRAAARYEGALRVAILRFKTGRGSGAHAFAPMLAAMASGPFEGAVIVPVPSLPERAAERGFDPGLLLARETAKLLEGVAVVAGLRNVAGDRQRGRSRSARLAAHGRFTCTAPVLAGVPVVLLDDVTTTGATLLDCASALERARATVAGAIVLAAA